MSTIKNIILAIIITVGSLAGIFLAYYLLVQLLNYIADTYGHNGCSLVIGVASGLPCSLLFSHLQSKRTK